MQCIENNGTQAKYNKHDPGFLLVFVFKYFVCIFLFRFFFGKNKVMIIALGRGKEAEYRENLHRVANVSSY